METTIQIKKDLKERLNALRLYPNESYDSIIRRLSELAEDEEPLSKDTIEKIEMSLKDIKEGRVYTNDEVRKRLKIA
jgi:predicted transcriptional regulator